MGDEELDDLLVASDGWVTLSGPTGADGLHLRVRDQDGRVVITDMYLHGPEVMAAALREISISRLEAELNNSVPAQVAARQPAEQREPTLAQLRERLARIGGGRTRPQRKRVPLTRPDGTAPDDFYRQVADAYREYAPQTRAPAAEIAREADVPVTTVHRWIREARRRGFLPPGRKGKAG